MRMTVLQVGFPSPFANSAPDGSPVPRLSYGMKLWKEDDPKLPMLPIKEYENQVADGADGYCILGRMANDYKKLIHPVKKYQRER